MKTRQKQTELENVLKMFLNFLTKLTTPIGHKEQAFKSSNVRFLLVVNRLQVSSLSSVCNYTYLQWNVRHSVNNNDYATCMHVTLIRSPISLY